MLAALVIGTIFILLIGNALLFGLKQYKSQSTKAQELTDVTFIAKVITKEIRKSTEISVNEQEHSITLTIYDNPIEYIFMKTEKALFKNGQKLYSGLENFQVTVSDRNDRLLEITIDSVNQNGIQENLKTEIYLREGVTFAK